MLDGDEYFECICGADEHALRFILNKEDKEIYTSVFMDADPRWYMRAWLMLKYVFGYRCRYGYFGSWCLRKEDVNRLKDLLNKL